MYGFKHLVIYLLIFLLNNKTIHSSYIDGIGFSLNSPKAIDELVTALYKERDKLINQHNQVKKQWEEFNATKGQVLDPNEFICLNVGGQIIVTHRATLIKIPNSLLAKSFDGSYQNYIKRDFDGSYFLDYNPILFSHLLDQLRTLKNNETIVFRPPLSSLYIKPFYQMVEDLGLPLPQQSENDLIALNVGGEKIVTLRKTLTGLPNSKLALLATNSTEIKHDQLGRPFLDYNPTIFRHLLDQLREGKKINDNTLQSPTNADENVFKAMINDLAVPSNSQTNSKIVVLTTSKPKSIKRKKPKRHIWLI